MDIVLLFPGQGSQKPGMGKDLAQAFPVARSVFGEVDAAIGSELSKLCFEGPADELTQTSNAQPALFAHGAAVWALTKNALQAHVRCAAGHSLGEFTAYHAADALGLTGGAKLVRRRGELMQTAGTARPGTMAAILGQMSTPITELCERASREGAIVVPANFNTDEQTVVSGEIAGVERVMELAKEAGAKRAIRLPVSGAFHSPLMEPAAVGLSAACASTAFTDPAFPVYSNVTAAPCGDATGAKELLVRQLMSPVRWAQQMRAIAASYPNATYVEMGPGQVLRGMITRLVPDAQSLSCGTPAEVESLLELVA
ncbi:MAG TPA: ACP S-malonyltransferase [Gemmatimonadaceae bacterium]|nr:ACP S-malonyltransferase [Gemmatimonadaceae bacterium]